MYQLEERILFDGAAAADVAAAQQDVQNQQAQDNQAAQPQADPSEQAQDQAQDTHEPSPILNPDSAPVVQITDASADANSAAAAITPATAANPTPDTHVNVLVVSDSLENADTLFQSANSNTIVVHYDSKTTTSTELLQQITDALNGEKADSIGFVTDKAHDGAIEIFADSDTSAESLSSDAQKNFWNGIEGLLAEKGKVNIFASELASTDNGRHLVDSLSQITNHQVAASTDVTGDADAGGNWELEYVSKGTGSVNLIDEYFNRDSIQSFDHRIEDPTEIAFIDSSVRDASTIVSQLDSDVEVVYLSRDNAFNDITDYLNGRTDVDSIHIISDADYTTGGFFLGNETVDNDFVANHQDALAGWGNSMSVDGDIHIYGCNVAKDQVGKDLVTQIASLTGADVAASTDITGLAGNWNLEYSSGTIETHGFIINDYYHNLNTFTVRRLDDALIINPLLIDQGNLTLREAIYVTVNGDNIQFADYTVLHSATSTTPDIQPWFNGHVFLTPTISLVDTLVITTNITIDGNIVTPAWSDAGQNYPLQNNSVIIDAGNSFRAIYIDSARNPDQTGVSLNNMVVQNGRSLATDIAPAAGSGGGIYVSGISTLNLQTLAVPAGGTEATVRNSQADYGGGIYNAGILTSAASSIYGNHAVLNGGGIYNGGTMTLAGTSPLSMVRIGGTDISYQNTAGGDGGGIYSSNSDLSMMNVLIGNNSAAGNGGGAYLYSNNYEVTGPVQLSSVDFMANHANGDGGGLYLANGNPASIANVLEMDAGNIIGNISNGRGGGAYLQSGVETFQFSSVAGNKAEADGGGIYVDAAGSLALFNSTVANNTAGGTGGGISFFSDKALNMDFSTVANNQSGWSVAGAPSGIPGAFGGGIYMDNGALTMANSVLAQNFSGAFDQTAGVHDDLYANAGTSNINRSVYGTTGGAGTVTPDAFSIHAGVDITWADFKGKLDTQVLDNGGKTGSVYVIDGAFFQIADPANTLQVDQTMTDVWSARATVGSYEKAAKTYFYVDGSGEIGSGSSAWVSGNGLLLSEADGVLNASDATFVLETGLVKAENYHTDYTGILSPTLGFLVSSIPVNHNTSGNATLRNNWDLKDAAVYNSSLLLNRNADFTVAPDVALGGKISVSSAAGDANRLDLQTSNLATTMLSIHSTGLSDNIVTYSSASPAQTILTVDETGASNSYDYLNLFGKDRGIAPLADPSVKNAAGTLIVLRDLTVGFVDAGPDLRDNVKLNITTAGANSGDLVFYGENIHDFGQIEIQNEMDAANFIIDGIADFSILKAGILTLTDFSMDNMMSITVNAGDLTMTRGAINNVPTFDVVAGNLMMTDVTITNGASVTVSGFMTMNASSIDGAAAVTLATGSLDMLDSSITSASTLTATVGGFVSIDNSVIDGTATSLAATGDLSMINASLIQAATSVGGANVTITDSTITGIAAAISATGSLVMANSAIIDAASVVSVGDMTLDTSIITGSPALVLGSANLMMIDSMITSDTTIAGTLTGGLTMSNSAISGTAVSLAAAGDLVMTFDSMIAMATSVSAFNIDMTTSTINGSAATIAAGGYLMMADSVVTGAASVTVAGAMGMDASSIDGAAVTVAATGDLTMINGSLIQTAASVSGANVAITDSAINGIAAAIGATGSFSLTNSTILDAASVTVTGAMTMTTGIIDATGAFILGAGSLGMTDSSITSASTIAATVNGNVAMNNSVIDGTTTTLAAIGDLTMINFSMIQTAASVSAVNMTITDSSITGIAAVIGATGNLALTNSAITDAASVTVTGAMTMGTSIIDALGAFVLGAGSLGMTDSLITSASTIAATVNGNVAM
ncbi:MAG TPA: hypothetical protein DET40_15480, partial [Lentisphaeria bacterium]|nr:hypothetical protein [Lentisphaeria bacterium]